MCKRNSAPVLLLRWSLEKSPDLWWGLNTDADDLYEEGTYRGGWFFTMNYHKGRSLREQGVTHFFTYLEPQILKTRCQEDQIPFKLSRGKFLFCFWFDFCLSGPLALLAILPGLLPCQHLALFTMSSFVWADLLHWFIVCCSMTFPAITTFPNTATLWPLGRPTLITVQWMKLFHKRREWTEWQFSVMYHFHNN